MGSREKGSHEGVSERKPREAGLDPRGEGMTAKGQKHL